MHLIQKKLHILKHYFFFIATEKFFTNFILCETEESSCEYCSWISKCYTFYSKHGYFRLYIICNSAYYFDILASDAYHHNVHQCMVLVGMISIWQLEHHPLIFFCLVYQHLLGLYLQNLNLLQFY